MTTLEKDEPYRPGRRGKVPKKFQIFEGIKPEKLFLSRTACPCSDRVYIYGKDGYTRCITAGAMKRENAEKLIEDYKRWYNENPSHG